MSFQIKKLILWPNNTAFPPREVDFELNTVNVITGGSRTGKSAIIPIIDYCLGASKCNIPIDTIRDYVSWYGIVLRLGNEEILIARRVPSGSKLSDDFYWKLAEKIATPIELKEPNCTREEVKSRLNELLGLPYFRVDANEDNSGYKARLSIRDLMMLVFQTQDIVANQNILFYKTHAHEHRDRLRNWLPYILGAETIEVLKARQRLQILERKLSGLKREFDKEKMISEEWKSNIYGHLKTAVDYGLLKPDSLVNDSPEYLIYIAKSLLTNIPDAPVITMDSVNTSSAEIKLLEEQENDLALQISMIKKRLEDVDSLKDGFTGYGEVVQKRVERLHISKWLSSISQKSEACPVCGDNDHPHATLEMQKISSALEKYENEARKHIEVPTAFQREELRLRQELEELLEKRSDNQNRYDWLVSRDAEAKKEFYKKKEMYIYIGHLKASLERFEKLIEGGDLEERIRLLQEECNQLKPLVDEEAIKKRVEAATKKISTKMLGYLQKLDVEDKYRERPPVFNVKELAILVMSNEGDLHFLAEVGSASNWVSFHIALLCSLQEFFSELEHSSVPSFVIFDQPSQVYFPKVRISSEEQDSNDFKDFKDEDLEAVKRIFEVLSTSVSSKRASWQFIVLDHADSDVYGNIDNINEVDVWRDGKKLVPVEWIDEK